MCITAFSYFFGKMIDALNYGLLVNVFIRAMISVLVLEEIAFRSGHALEIFIKTKIRSNVKKALFEHSRSLSFGYFADRFAGEIAHNISICADAFEQLIIIITNEIVYVVVMMLASIVILSDMHS